MFPHRLARTFGLLALLLLPVSCDSIDPEYQTLLAAAETNPPKQAHLGMWHRKDDYGVKSSLLFSRDGTGLTDTVVGDGWGGQVVTTDEIGPFTWTYDGGGIWSMKNTQGRTDTCRMAGGKLLRFYDARAQTGGAGYWVYERVQP